jgi:hypothetical protein
VNNRGGGGGYMSEIAKKDTKLETKKANNYDLNSKNEDGGWPRLQVATCREGNTECAVKLHHLQNGAAKPRE